VLNHSATNKTDRENTTRTTTNNLTTVSAQNRPQQSSSKKELLDAHFMAKKYKRKIEIFLNLSFLCLSVSVSPEEHTECPLILRMTRDGISTIIPSMVK
jgi:hypothetical protein